MSYVAKILQPGETVRYVGRLHWVTYWPAIGLFLLAAIIYALHPSVPTGFIYTTMNILALLALAAGAVIFVPIWINWWTTEIVVTDRRIVLKTGLIRRHTNEMNMTKVSSVDVEQTIMGRVLNYGDITIVGAGTGFEELRLIAKPLELRNHITAE